MSDNSTSSFSNQASRTDWVRIHQMTDADLDYSDSPAEDEAFWAMWWSGLRRKDPATKATSMPCSGPMCAVR